MMLTPLFAAFTAWHYIYTIGLSVLSIFLILVILVQRGRGGGLTGALGGMGGQSAFGTKAGDLFTKVTIGVAIVWVLSTMLIIKYVGSQSQTGGLSTTKSSTTTTTPAVKTGSKTETTNADDKKGSGIGAGKTPETKTPAKTPETKTPASKTPVETKSGDEK
ncbi:MAG: preprotein translocase subunit SecG [Pirellulaceae bacterium]